MDTLELDFEQAKNRHLLFKTKLRSILYGAEIDEQPVLSHFDCAVGKWIYGHAIKAYGHIPEMHQLEKVHATIHESARELIHLYKNGKVEEARRGLFSMELIADNLVALLTVIEMKLKLANHPVDQADKGEKLSINYKELLELHDTIRDLDTRFQKQSEELYAAKGSIEKKLKDNFAQAPVGICILRGKDFTVELANDLYLQLVNQQTDFVGKPYFESLEEPEGKGIREMLTGLMNSGQPFVENEMEVPMIRNGIKELAYFNFVYQSLVEGDGSVNGIMIVCTEVTAQVLAKKTITENEIKLNIAIDSAELGTFELNLLTQEVIYSGKYLKILGFESDEKPTREQIVKNIHPDDMIDRNKGMNSAMVTGTLNYEFRTIWKDKSIHWVKAMGRVYYEDDKPVKVLGTVMDITETKLAQEKVMRANRTLEIAMEAGNLGSFELELETGKSNFNAVCKMNFDFPADMEVTVTDVLNSVHPDDKEKMQSAMATAIKNATNYTAEYRIRIQDNSIRWITSSGKAVYDESGKALKLIGVNANITNRKKAEEELNLSFEKFKLLADSMPQFIWTGDPSGNLNYFNQSVFDFSGLSPEQINAEGWLQIVHPDDRPMNIEKWIHSITTGEDFLFEHRFKKHTGEYRWQLSRAIPQKNSDGEIQMWVGTSTDIQEQKTFTKNLENLVEERTQELKLLNLDLENMNQELRTFAYISSHDLQEPLRKIQTFVSRIHESDGKTLSTEGKKYFERVQYSAFKMKALINDLLTYSRTSATEKIFEKINLSDLLDEIKTDLNELLSGKNIALEIHGMPEMNAIPFQIRQLFTNLISNSVKFSKNEGQASIQIHSKRIPGQTIDHKNAFRDCDYFHFSVKDNGIGFDPQFKEKIFEVFQKLHQKSEYEGSGIGLSICNKIVQNHNGFMVADSEKDKGATFNIYIPAN